MPDPRLNAQSLARLWPPALVLLLLVMSAVTVLAVVR